MKYLCTHYSYTEAKICLICLGICFKYSTKYFKMYGKTPVHYKYCKVIFGYSTLVDVVQLQILQIYLPTSPATLLPLGLDASKLNEQ